MGSRTALALVTVIATVAAGCGSSNDNKSSSSTSGGGEKNPPDPPPSKRGGGGGRQPVGGGGKQDRIEPAADDRSGRRRAQPGRVGGLHAARLGEAVPEGDRLPGARQVRRLFERDGHPDAPGRR